MDDVSDITSLATSTPDDAAKNISNANLFGITPAYAAENKSTFDEKASTLEKPQQAEPPVNAYMRQSPEHAAVATPDVDKLNYMSRQMKLIGDYMFDRPTTQQNLVDLNLKKIKQGGQLSSDDEIQLSSLNQDASEQQDRNYGITGPIEKLPAEIAGGISDLGQSIVRGARKGILEGALPNKGLGLGANMLYGAMVKDPFDTLTAGTYNELSNQVDSTGQPKNIDHDTKLAISRGVGVIGTALMNVGGAAIVEAAPFLKPFMNPALASKLINTPAKAAVVMSIGQAMKGAAGLAGASGLTEVTRIIGEEMGKNFGTDEAGFWNSLTTASQKLGEYAPRVGKATAGGFAMGLALEAPLQIAGFGRTKQNFEQGFEHYVSNLPESRDVTPDPTKQLTGEHPKVADDIIDITPDEGGSPHEQAFKAIQFNEALHNINDVQRSTGMADIAPGELSEVNKQGFLAAGFNKFYSTFEAMRNWATSDEKGLAIRNLINPEGVAAGQMNAPFELEPHHVMEIAKEYPDILDHVKASPNDPTGIQAKDHLEALNRAKDDAANIMQKLGVKPEDIEPPSNVMELPERPKPTSFDLESVARRTQEIFDEMKAVDPKSKKWEALDTELADLKDKVTKNFQENPPGSMLAFPFDEKGAATKAELEYGRAPTFTEAISKVLPPEAVAKYNGAQLRARMTVTDMVHDAAVHEMNQVVDQTTQMAKEDQRRAELDRIAHDPNYAIVDKFHAHQVANAKGKNKRSMYAVDPTTLPDSLLHYTDNGQLKAHKVFVKGARGLEDSARALGFSNGKDMLDVLARTPTSKQIVKARSEFYDSHIEQMAKSGVDLDNVNIMKAFTDRTKAHIEEMRFMREQEWPQAKYGIKKIALPLPKIEQLEIDAREAVKKMKVGSLTPAQFVVGERQSHRIAVDAIVKNEVEKAFQAKEMAARNNEMQKSVRKAIAEVNRVQKFARRLEDPAAQQVLKTAGKLAQNAMDEILDVFNFNPKRKNQAELDQYQKWMKREVEQGRGDFSIPKRLSDVRKSINEMTVEQVLVAGDRMKTIFKEAQYKAELIENKDLREEERSIDRIAEQVMNAAAEHPATGQMNVPPVQDTVRTGQAVFMWLQDKQMAFANMEHVLRFYDQGKFNGFFQKTFMHQLKGDGAFDKKSGYSKENAMIQKFAETVRKIMDNHGSFEKVEKQILNIPEFKDIQGLNGGQLTKGDLITAFMYKGDPDGQRKLQNNFRNSEGKSTSLETWQKVFDEHLTEADVTAAQYFVDMFKGYHEETRDLQNRTKGEDVNFIKGVPNQWKEKTFPGGYLPQKHKYEFSAEAADRVFKDLKNKKAAFFEKGDGAEFGRQFAAEQTEQGRTIDRTDSDKPLDLSLLRALRGHEEVIHDLSYREAVMNNLKLLRDKRIRDSMIAMGGRARYNLLVNTVIEMAGRAEATNANYFSDQNRFFKSMFGRLQTNFNVTVLGLNLTSTAIQYESLTQLMQNAGAKGAKHFALVNAKMMSHPQLWGATYEWANELDPTIGHFMEGIQNKITSVVHDIVPTKSKIPFLTPFNAAHQFAVSKMMAPMALADIHLKIMGAMTGYSQFMAGDADNWPLEKVQALTDTEKHQEAQAYVRQLSRLSLTHARPEDKAPFQKNPMTQFFANYWNDLRNVLNNEISQGNKINWNVQSGIKALKTVDAGGGGEPPNKGPTRFDDMRDGGEGRKTKFEGGTSAAGYFGTAAGIAMMTIVASTMGRWYSDKNRGIQQTPDQWPLDLRTPKGIAEASKKMMYYSLMSPADQLMSVEPIVKDTFFAANMPDKVIRGFVDKTKTVQLPVTKELSDIATAGNSLADIYQNANNLSEFLMYLGSLDNKETKAIMNAVSYTILPGPVNAYSKLMRALDLPLNSPGQILPTALDKLYGLLGQTIARHDDKGPDHLQLNDKFVDHLRDIHQQIAPVVATVPPGMTDTLKYAMSGADWSKPNGIYNFSKEQWESIQKSAPDLGLTNSGRIAKDTTQQEKAADWYLHDAAKTLASADVRITPQALYGAFRLGVQPYETLYKAPADAKVKTVLSQDVLDKNPDLSNFKTVGQLKNYLGNQYDKAARDSHPKTAQLTEATPKAED